VTVQLTAGASSSSQTCWLVGASGTVLRTTDGRTWVSVNLPEPVDLIAVEAVDAAIAVVTAADGRRFRTSNGGQSWTRI
jgi:photosystem II stability/assembly factor-like uncharacterized protein